MTPAEFAAIPTPETEKFVNEFGLIGRHQIEYEHHAKSLELRLHIAREALQECLLREYYRGQCDPAREALRVIEEMK